MKTAIITINKPSFLTALSLKKYLNKKTDIFINHTTNLLIDDDLGNIKVYVKLNTTIKTIWDKYDAIVFIVAIGAVVRTISPFVQSKQTDPAVLVVNLNLTRVIPLLGGHLAQANKLSIKLSKKLKNCVNFITTATDQTKTFAFDNWAKKNNMHIKNLKSLANISNRLINNQPIHIITHKNIVKHLNYKNSVLITPFDTNTKQLTILPKIFLGIGCSKNISSKILFLAVKLFLKQNNLKFEQIKTIASFEAKKDEKGLIRFAKKYNLKIMFFKKNKINKLKDNFTNSKAKDIFKVQAVAEPCAILSSTYKELIVKKTIYFKSVTIACAI
jgi:cobalt-precorrin 5A hydrolase